MGYAAIGESFMYEILKRINSWYPPVGVFIGILALLGVLVPLFRDITKIGRREKAMWTAAMFALVLLEIRSIYLDRADHDHKEHDARELQLNGFQNIADGIKVSVSNSQAHFAETMASIRQNIDVVTGGDSFCYLDLTRSVTPTIVVEGKNPLHGVSATINDFKEMERIVKEVAIRERRPPKIQEIQSTQLVIRLNDMPGYHGEPLEPIPPFLQKRAERDLDIIFLAFNGMWTQHLCLRRATNSAPGSLVLASATTVMRGQKVLLHHVDANYPAEQPCN
jgi:hypothetical protein